MRGTPTIVGTRSENRAALVDLVRQRASATSPVLVIVPRVSSGHAWRSELLRRYPEQSGFVRVTTPRGFAVAVVRSGRSGRANFSLLSGTRLRGVVAELLRSDETNGEAIALWPTQHRYLSGPAFLDEVVRAVSSRSPGAATHFGQDKGRHRELASFLVRYEALLIGQGLVDCPMALQLAQERLRIDDPIGHGLDPSGGVVVEQQQSFVGADAIVVRALAERATRRGTYVAVSTTRPASAVVSHDERGELLRIHHPAVQADAILSVVSRWIEAGRPSDRIAVVLPRPDAVLLAELHCAATRCGTPLVVAGSRLGDSPIVFECAQAITDAAGLATATTTAHAANAAHASNTATATTTATAAIATTTARAATTATATDTANATDTTNQNRAEADLATNAFAWWLQNAPALLGDPRSVVLIATFIRALLSGEGVPAALDRRTPAAVERGVAVLLLDDAIDRPSDDPWQGVVLVGCVDGTFPQRRAQPQWFADKASVAPAHADPGESGEDALVAHDRQRLAELFEVVAADGHLVAVAAPFGGVLPSSFVDGWPRAELALQRCATIPPPRPTQQTVSESPLFPNGALRLSATQLTTFEDCSWRYGFEYGLGLRGVGGASATAGSFVHAVLESFLSAETTDLTNRSRTRLFALLDDFWHQDDFPYAAQALDYRRRAEQWLGNWWEFFCETAPDVRLTEHRFSVPFPAGTEAAAGIAPGTSPHLLVGSIDRVDLIGDGSADDRRTRIVDYKSGVPKSAADVAEDLQLAIYHYAATHDPTVRALGRPDRLELHYLQDNASKERVKVLARPVTDDLEQQTVTRIEALAAAILKEEYSPNPDANCEYCGFHSLCPTKQQGRNVP